ncbi:MAG: SRPBCC domain-containing protein [Alphaproteobacteria bacterium]|nr:SRPBCC domain-containing protein [Alphaproteobacteria bacterium]
MKQVYIKRVLPFPRDKVWLALTDSGHLAQWLMKNDFEPTVGHRFTFLTKPAPGFDGTVHCEVLELDPPNRLVISWKGGPVQTTLRFDLVAQGAETILELRHEGFQGLNNLLPRFFLGLGWKDLIKKKLPAHLATMA